MLELHLENARGFEDPWEHSIAFYRAKLLQSTTFFLCVYVQEKMYIATREVCVYVQQKHL